MDLEEFDPEADALDGDTVDAATDDEEYMGRVMRKLRFTRAELAAKDAMFGREADRIAARHIEVCEPLENLCDRLEESLTSWFQHKQRRQVAAGTDPAKVRKSFALADGTVKSRKSSRVDFAGEIAALPAWLVRVNVTESLDRKAVKDLVKAGTLMVDGDGRCVTKDGEVLPVSLIEETSFSVVTEEVTP